MCFISVSWLSVKPSMPETTALGAAMAAGAAEGVSVWSLSPEDLSEVTSEKFEPQINPEGRWAAAAAAAAGVAACCLCPAAAAVTSKVFLFSRFAESELRYARWKKAVQKSMNWETTEPVGNGNGERKTGFISVITVNLSHQVFLCNQCSCSCALV